jgi:hypothetical protein
MHQWLLCNGGQTLHEEKLMAASLSPFLSCCFRLFDLLFASFAMSVSALSSPLQGDLSRYSIYWNRWVEATVLLVFGFLHV